MNNNKGAFSVLQKKLGRITIYGTFIVYTVYALLKFNLILKFWLYYISKNWSFFIASILCFMPIIGDLATFMSLLQRGYSVQNCLVFFIPMFVIWGLFGSLYTIHLIKERNRRNAK